MSLSLDVREFHRQDRVQLAWPIVFTSVVVAAGIVASSVWPFSSHGLLIYFSELIRSRGSCTRVISVATAVLRLAFVCHRSVKYFDLFIFRLMPQLLSIERARRSRQEVIITEEFFYQGSGGFWPLHDSSTFLLMGSQSTAICIWSVIKSST